MPLTIACSLRGKDVTCLNLPGLTFQKLARNFTELICTIVRIYCTIPKGETEASFVEIGKAGQGLLWL